MKDKDWVVIYSNRTSPSLALTALETPDAETAGVTLHPSKANSTIDVIEDAYDDEDDSARDRSRRLAGGSVPAKSEAS